MSVRLITGGQREVYITPYTNMPNHKKKSRKKKKRISKAQKRKQWSEKIKADEEERALNRKEHYESLKRNENNMIATKVKIVSGKRKEEKYKIQNVPIPKLKELLLVILEDKKGFPLGGIEKYFKFSYNGEEAIKIICVKENKAYIHECECPKQIESEIVSLFKGRVW